MKPRVARSCPDAVVTDSWFARTQRFQPPALCATAQGVNEIEAASCTASPNEDITAYLSSLDKGKSSRRQLGHLPSVKCDVSMQWMTDGRCSSRDNALDLKKYDQRDFTFVVWTRGKPHMLVRV